MWSSRAWHARSSVCRGWWHGSTIHVTRRSTDSSGIQTITPLTWGIQRLSELLCYTHLNAGGDHDREAPPELAEPGEKEADHDDLLDQGVLGGGQDQHRYGPPVLTKPGGLHLGVPAQIPGTDVQSQARQADRQREQKPAADVEGGTPEIKTDPFAGRRVTQLQQVQRQDRRNQSERDADELVGEIQPWTVRRCGRVQRRGLLSERHVPGEAFDDPQQRVDRRLAERYAQYEQDLPGRSAPVDSEADRDLIHGAYHPRIGNEPGPTRARI